MTTTCFSGLQRDFHMFLRGLSVRVADTPLWLIASYASDHVMLFAGDERERLLAWLERKTKTKTNPD